jgi:soluble P-type ATPase
MIRSSILFPVTVQHTVKEESIMFRLDIPGFKTATIDHLVLDFNGTLALDGSLLPEVRPLVTRLSPLMSIHVLTADTHGRVRAELEGLPVRISVIEGCPEDEAKRDYVTRLGANEVAAVGNGRNDCLMLAVSVLGIAVSGEEGISPAALAAADVIVPNIKAGLNLFLNPLRLSATLRC